MRKENSTLIVMTPKRKDSLKEERTFRFDGMSQDYLDGFKDALEEIFEKYNIYEEKI